MREIGGSQLLNKMSNEKLKEYCGELKKKIDLNNRILFVKGPQLNLKTFEEDVARNRCYYVYPPTGLQYLAQAIEGRGLETQILDLNYEFLNSVNRGGSTNWISFLEKKLQDYRPSIIGVSNLFTVDTPGFLKILEYLKRKEHIIIAGGQNATYEGTKLLEKDLCHFVCERESENKINFLLDNLFGKDVHKATPGIYFKYKDEIIETNGEKDVVELKGNLINSYKLVPIEKYCQVGTLSPYSRMVGVNEPFAALLFVRGCQGKCKFCGVVDYMGKGIRSREVKDFLDELEYLNKKRGIKFFELLDDNFTAKKDRALEVLQGIIDRKIDIKWASSNGIIAARLDEELMEKMRDSGCIGFKTGVESGNEEILKKIHKPGSLKSFKKFSALAQKFPEMFIVDNYIIGFPGETFSQILDSYKFPIEMNLDWSNFSVYQPNVSYFGEERKKIGDFTPTKDAIRGKLPSLKGVFLGKDIFEIPGDTVPSREQLNHIWFAFNLVRNFIMNKNIKPDGNHEKYLSWVETLEGRYPTHPYICLLYTSPSPRDLSTSRMPSSA